MSRQITPFPLRVNPEILAAVKIEAKRQGRSTNKQIEFWLRKKVEELKVS